MASTWGAGRLRALSRTTGLRALGLAAGFIALKAVSAGLVFPPQQNALLWLPSGLSLAVLLRADRQRWPAYLAAIFLAEFGAVWAYGDPPAVAACWAVGNCLRSWVGALLMRHGAGRWAQFTRVREVAVFLLAAGLLSPLPSATLGAGAAALAYGTRSFWADWLIWYLSDALGGLLVTPLLLSWLRDGQLPLGRRRALELTVTLGALMAATHAIFVNPAPEGILLSLPYSTLPLVLWTALRFGPRGASAASVAVGAIAVGYSTLGLGPFGENIPSPQERMLAVQSYTAVTGMSALTLAAVVCERKRFERAQRLLAEAGAVLSESLDWRRTLPRLARLIVPEMASGFAVWLTDADGGIQRAVQVGLDARQEARFREELQEATARPHYRKTEAEGSSVLVPLWHQEHLLGGLVLVKSARERPLAPRDVIFAEDLARRCSLAVENARLFQDAREALHARDEFLAIAAHELRTPLAALQLQFQSLTRQLQRMPESDEALAKLRRMARQTSRLAGLVENLLDVGRLHTGRLRLSREELDLGELARDVVTRLQEEGSRAGCEVTVVSEPHVTGWWDRVRLEQALTNLLSNALKFGAGRPIAIEVCHAGDGARLSVTDRGIGMEPESLQRIFGRFERGVSSREYGGLGLGLYLTWQIAEAHGGAVRVSSAPGAGATFTLELPGPSAAYAPGQPPTHHA